MSTVTDRLQDVVSQARKVLTTVDERVNEVIIAGYEVLNEVESVIQNTPKTTATSDDLKSVWSQVSQDLGESLRKSAERQASRVNDGYDFDWFQDRSR